MMLGVDILVRPYFLVVRTTTSPQHLKLLYKLNEIYTKLL
jgi:hypothetical protein